MYVFLVAVVFKLKNDPFKLGAFCSARFGPCSSNEALTELTDCYLMRTGCRLTENRTEMKEVTIGLFTAVTLSYRGKPLHNMLNLDVLLTKSRK